MIDWQIDSWRKFPIKQVPEYNDQDQVTKVENELSIRPPLVFAEEARRLRKRMADVAEGKAFLLQGGDCAESFAEHNANNIRDSFRVLLQMAVVLTFGSALPVVKIGRLAGQYSKPRSSPLEVIDNISLPSYRGDMVNDMAFNVQSRERDPER
jgi:3-deoxy-7-phosphoheptulonate synthase